ncbi:hypothetical protein IEQ34_016068 [Dendrobium chrysotoxum]|uniref:Protein kinase domain-containing protein n=1 Tax=Dendrobium chrysotoxum TaxID=161865 RepID=A0AAV7GEN1_DENCH|nr:hypothetical protein IEQ34_016068 [Dendrobium chrysotoxum]
MFDYSDHGINKLEQDLIKLVKSVLQSPIRIATLTELRELGSGTFGAVYHGKWRGPFVAIKRIHDIYFAGKSFIQERARADFWNEIFMLANLHHPNIITFYDIVWDGSRGSFVAITEYMVDSSVRSGIINSSEYVLYFSLMHLALKISLVLHSYIFHCNG